MRIEPDDYLEAARDRITDVHNLYVEKFVKTSEHSEISMLVFAVHLRWKNDLRFASEDRLKRRLKKSLLLVRFSLSAPETEE